MNPSALAVLSHPLLAARDESAPLPLLALTRGLAQGDDAAWAEFHRAYGPALLRQLLAATRGDYHLASEALQHAYLRIARHARPCEVEASFHAWLRIVARTALSDCRRRRLSFWQLLRRRRDEPDDPAIEAAEEERVQRALDTALAALAPDERHLLEEKYLAGLPVRTLAEKRQLSPKAVESRLTRARAELRHHLLAALSRRD